MVLRGADVLGRPLAVLSSGETTEYTIDLLLDPLTCRVTDVVLDKPGIFGKFRLLPYQAVQLVGEDSLVVEGLDQVRELTDEAEYLRLTGGEWALKGMQIYTQGGRLAGRVADLYFEEQSGVAASLEVSGGLLVDTVRGRSLIPVESVLGVAKDVITVQTTERMEEELGVAAPVAQPTTAQPDFWEEAESWALSQTEDDYALFRTRRVLGRPVRRAVLDRWGRVVVAGGQTVTEHTVDRARQAGVVDDLVAATEAGTGRRWREPSRTSAVPPKKTR